MDKIEIPLRVVTPLFVGGANATHAAELRAPSVKGVLRFWYRALDPDYKDNEPRIFGGTGKNEGQACFILRITDQQITRGEAKDERWNGTKTAYLGFGPIVRDKGIKKSITVRAYVKCGSTFTLSVLFKPRTPANHKEWVRRALWAMIMLGGFGARSRKGFGSLIVAGRVSGMSDLPTLTCKDSNELADAIKDFLTAIPCATGLPEHTSYSQDSRCVIALKGKTGEDALESLGREMHAYRSWKGEKNFQPDHDAMRDFIGPGISPAAPPTRSAFGLPHNYFYTSLGNKKGGVDYMDGNKPGRRASPLLLHVHEFASATSGKPGGACVVAIFLPARLIPAGATVQISGDGQTSVSKALPDNFSAVAGFVDRLANVGRELSHDGE